MPPKDKDGGKKFLPWEPEKRLRAIYDQIDNAQYKVREEKKTTSLVPWLRARARSQTHHPYLPSAAHTAMPRTTQAALKHIQTNMEKYGEQQILRAVKALVHDRMEHREEAKQVRPSVRPSACLSVCLSVRPFVHVRARWRMNHTAPPP